MAITVLIGDDEELARRRLRRLLAEFDDVEIAGECVNGVDVLRRLAEGPVDILLLDINMPGMSGIEATKLLPEPRPYVVFCTAHAEHAVLAFDVGAVDYLLKPIEAERLARALERARRSLEQGRAETRPATRGDGALARLPVATHTGIVLIDPATIVSATLDGELVRLRTTRGDHLTDDSLQALHDKLQDGSFERVHRRALVNLTHVVRLEPLETGGYLAHTVLGDSVEVSRQSARALRKRLGLRKGDES
jgi:two-component system LytT family response regulator